MARKPIESKLKQGLPTYIPLPNTLRKKKKKDIPTDADSAYRNQKSKTKNAYI